MIGKTLSYHQFGNRLTCREPLLHKRSHNFNQSILGRETMKSAYPIALCILLLFVSACAQKVNDPADVKAIKDLLAAFPKAVEGNDAAFPATYYKQDAMRLPPNYIPVKGKDAIVKAWQNEWANYKYTDMTVPVDEVLTSGDLAIARGTAQETITPHASGLSINKFQGKWVGVYQRQSDGSWKCAFDIWNSDAPATGATADGAEEAALYQLERDWAAASMKKDVTAIDKFLAKDFVSNFDGRTLNKAQLLAQIKSNPAKIESTQNSDMVAMVFGDTAVVRGIYTEKSTTNGKDSSVKGRYTEVYAKRDGRWQCVTQYTTKL
jgi:ketosteroid isomerase-like protein